MKVPKFERYGFLRRLQKFDQISQFCFEITFGLPQICWRVLIFVHLRFHEIFVKYLCYGKVEIVLEQR